MKSPRLWNKMKMYPLVEPIDGGCYFCINLAIENNWSVPYAIEVIEEYRRFAYLQTISESELSPSYEVDKVWHFHLSYTRHYWGEWTKILGRELHHCPAETAEPDDNRYEYNYKRTLDMYRHEFKAEPNNDIWPPVESKDRHKQINKRNKAWARRWASLKLAMVLVPCIWLFINAERTPSGTYLLLDFDFPGNLLYIMILVPFVSMVLSSTNHEKKRYSTIRVNREKFDEYWLYSISTTKKSGREFIAWEGKVKNQTGKPVEIDVDMKYKDLGDCRGDSNCLCNGEGRSYRSCC